jgi:hypothetical protein
VNYRDYHASTHAGDWRMNIEPAEHGLRVLAFGGAVPIYLFAESGSSEPNHEVGELIRGWTAVAACKRNSSFELQRIGDEVVRASIRRPT